MNCIKKNIFKVNKIPRFSEIRIESTNYCGCNCFMCPITKMTRKKGIMSIENLIIILKELKYINYDISFQLHGHGESLLCKDLPQRIRLIKQSNSHFLPQITTTLAYELNKEWFYSLFKEGIQKIIVSLYGYDKKTYKAIHGVDKFEQVKENLKLLANIKKGFPKVEITIQLDDFKENYPCEISASEIESLRTDFIKYLYAIGFEKDNITYWCLHNYGNFKDDFPKNQMNHPCSILWGTRKNILQIDWELNVIPCCFDFDSKYSWGNLKNNSLKEIFKSKERLQFLEKIEEGNNIPLCIGCLSNKEVLDKQSERKIKHPILYFIGQFMQIYKD